MKLFAGAVLAVLSMIGLAHPNKAITPSPVAVTFPKTTLLSAAAPSIATIPAPKPSKPEAVVSSPAAVGVVLGTTTDSVVTQSQLQAAIQQASDQLRQLIYANAGTIGEGQYSTGGITNSIALSNRIDQLNGTTLTNVVVNGVQGLAAADIPDLSAKYVTVSAAGTALSGLFTSNVGIGTTSPTSLLTLDSTSTTGTILRLSNSSTGGHEYDLLDTGSANTNGAGRLDFFDKTAGVARLSIAANGNVGIGSTSPAALLTVVGTIAQSIGGQQPFAPPYQSTPITTGFSTAGEYNDSSSGNIFHLSSYAQNSGTAPVVAIFGEGVSAGSAWGANFVGYSNGATANAQGVEIDYGVLTNGGTATGLLVAGAGNFAPSTAIQIQSNNTSSIPANGINFHYRSAQSTNPASNSLIETSGAVSLPLGIDFSSATFSSAAIKLPSSTASSSGIAFGTDTDVYRTAANTLATDGGFRAGGSATIGTTTSPTHVLEVAGGTAGAETELLELWSPYNNGNTATGITFVNNSTEGAVSGGAQIAAIRGTSGSSNLVFRVANTSSTLFEAARLTSAGNLGVGTSTPYSRLTVWGSDTASSTSAFSIVNNASTTEFQVFDGGNAQLAGTLTQNSDQRLKTNIQSLDSSSSLAAIDALNPVTFNWIDPTQGTTPQIGFIAQQVQQLFPALISTTSPTPLTPGGTLGLNYIGLISPVVSAIQALSAEVTSLSATVAGFAQSFTSKQITATQQLCVGSTCINQQQLASLLALEQQGQVQISAPIAPTISGTTTPPSISIQGDNPSIIQIGDTYTDLGAIATDNEGATLGYNTFLNGALVSNISIDTTQVATDTIDYVATDTWGNTSTSTRTVIVEAAASSTSMY